MKGIHSAILNEVSSCVSRADSLIYKINKEREDLDRIYSGEKVQEINCTMIF